MKINNKFLFVGILTLLALAYFLHRHEIKTTAAMNVIPWQTCAGGRWCTLADLNNVTMGPTGDKSFTYYTITKGTFLAWIIVDGKPQVVQQKYASKMTTVMVSLGFKIGFRDDVYITWTEDDIMHRDVPF